MAYGQNNEKWTGFYLANDIAKLPIGTRLLESSAHVTLSPPCEVETSRLPDIDEFLASIAGETEPITLRSIGQAFFGRRDRPTLVTRFEKPRALDHLHTRLVRGLAEIGCEYIGLEYALEKYQPHSEGLLLDPDTTIPMDNVTLFAERKTPRFKGLDEVTARYEFAN